MKRRWLWTLSLFVITTGMCYGMFSWAGIYALPLALWRKIVVTLCAPTIAAGLWHAMTRKW